MHTQRLLLCFGEQLEHCLSIVMQQQIYGGSRWFTFLNFHQSKKSRTKRELRLCIVLSSTRSTANSNRPGQKYMKNASKTTFLNALTTKWFTYFREFRIFVLTMISSCLCLAALKSYHAVKRWISTITL